MTSNNLEVSDKEINDETNRIMLIDLENCPSQIHQLMKDLEKYSHVVVCYAQSGAKIPLDWIIPLNPIVNDNRLRIVKMPNPYLRQSRRADEIDFHLPFAQKLSVNIEARAQGCPCLHSSNPHPLRWVGVGIADCVRKFFLTQAKISVSAAGVTPSMRPA